MRISFDIQATHEPANVNGTTRDVLLDVEYRYRSCISRTAFKLTNHVYECIKLMVYNIYRCSNGRSESFTFTTGVETDTPQVPDMQLFLFMDNQDETTYLDKNQGYMTCPLTTCLFYIKCFHYLFLSLFNIPFFPPVIRSG